MSRGVPCPRSGGGTPSHVLGGTPSHVWEGTPSQVWGGTPSQVRGYPIPSLGVPHPKSGGYPDLGLGPPLSRPGMGYPLWPDLGWGTPQTLDPEMGYPPPTSVDRYTDWCQNITFPRTTYAGGNDDFNGTNTCN